MKKKKRKIINMKKAIIEEKHRNDVALKRK